MPDIEPQPVPKAAAATGASVVQRLRLAAVVLFMLGLLVQFYLAGRGAFGASSYSAHKHFGDALHFVPGVIPLLTLASRATRNRVDIVHAVLLIVLFEVQFALADLKHPTAGAFHPVNAVLILGVTYSLFRRDLRAVSSRRAAVQP